MNEKKEKENRVINPFKMEKHILFKSIQQKIYLQCKSKTNYFFYKRKIDLNFRNKEGQFKFKSFLEFQICI